MHFLPLTLATPAANLALEDSLLEQAENGELEQEFLRIWSATEPFVVVGRGSRIAQEVNLQAAEAAGIPIFRRISGGASIVAAPGCMMYAVLLSYEKRPHLRMLDMAHEYVMGTIASALRNLVPTIEVRGTCDLVLNNRKVSGNSLRCRRNWMLYHGTLLLHMDLSLVDQLLLHPPREPEYRQGRPHSQFVANLHVDFGTLTHCLKEQWQATETLALKVPETAIKKLVSDRYTNRAWTLDR